MRRILYSVSVAVIMLVGVSLYHHYSNAHDERITVEVSGISRSAILHIPAHMDRSHTYPLVLGFHPVGGNAGKYAWETQIFAKGEKAGFLVLCPEGTRIGNENSRQGWNSGTKDFTDLTHNADDIAFVRALLAQVEADYSIDAKRIYATGFSNGAQMSYLLALKMADVFAAIAPMSGARQADGLKPSRPVPILHFHGSQDPVYPFIGGHSILKMIHSPLEPVPNVIAEWCEFNGASLQPAITIHDNWVMHHHAGVAPVDLVLVHNMDHRVAQQPDAIAMALQFFKQHPMP